MQYVRIACAAWACLLLLTCLPASAHHAFADEYDREKVIEIAGVVTRFDWANPHVLLYVYAPDARGGAGTSWTFEMGATGGLVRRGWKRSDLQRGDRIILDGYLAKDGSHRANARNVTLADGRRLFGGFQETPGNPFR